MYKSLNYQKKGQQVIINLIFATLAIVLATSLLGTVDAFVQIGAGNVTDATTQTITRLIPLFFIFTVIIALFVSVRYGGL